MSSKQDNFIIIGHQLFQMKYNLMVCSELEIRSKQYFCACLDTSTDAVITTQPKRHFPTIY